MGIGHAHVLRFSKHSSDRADDDESDAEPQIKALIFDEARRDALINDVALLEEQLPRRDRGADAANDDQHHIAQLPARGQLGNDEITGHLRERRVGRATVEPPSRQGLRDRR